MRGQSLPRTAGRVPARHTVVTYVCAGPQGAGGVPGADHSCGGSGERRVVWLLRAAVASFSVFRNAVYPPGCDAGGRQPASPWGRSPSLCSSLSAGRWPWEGVWTLESDRQG